VDARQRYCTTLVLLALAGCSPGPQPLTGPAPTKITERVYVLVGPLAFPNKENRGYINNPAFVLTDKGAVVIDPGSSAAVGQMVLEQLRTLTDKPVVAIFNTHIHGDHWLANGTIKKAYPTAVIYAHPKMKEKAATDGPGWIRLFDELTGGAMVGTVPLAPDLAIEDGEIVKIGGISFRVHHTGHAHTDGDIMVELPEEHVLFAGDIINNQAVRRMDDGSFQGNITAIDRALALSVVHFVPGHGAPGERNIAQQNRAYFATLYSSVKELYDEGRPDFEIKPKVVEALAPFARWDAFDGEIGRQVGLAYLEVEREAF
jgi:glyoxylase-like metal-dependent hydrolase (beta-lactamase superfamily II)